MNIPSYVYQNGFAIYYFRIAIPKHLKPTLRKHEIRKSLKTTNYHQALRQARRFAVITEHLFQAGIASINDINSAFQRCKDHPTIFLDAPTSDYSGDFGYRVSHQPSNQRQPPVHCHQPTTPQPWPPTPRPTTIRRVDRQRLKNISPTITV